MKKILFVFVLVAILATGTAFAQVHPGGLGLGVVWSGAVSDGNFGHSGAGLSLKLPKNPVYWGIFLQGSGGNFGLGLTGDYYLYGNKFLPFLGFYLGLGGYGSFAFGDAAAIGLGARVPIGLTFQPIDIFEIFLDVAPSLGASFWTAGDGGFDFPNFFVPIEIGIRLWL